MDRERYLFWLWLADQLGAESRDFSQLIFQYQPFDLFRADDDELERIEGISPKTVAALSKKDLSRATEIFERCRELGIKIIPYDATEYPGYLKGMRCPPIVLYCKGQIPDMNRRLCIGTVGTRKMSRYGMRVAYQAAYQLASVGAVVVSGMASGIDGVCAAAAIAAGGTTVAVVGAGIDVVYPKHHEVLMEEIVKNGAVISEYPPGTPVKHYQFPVRNRIISGLSQATVVIEAGLSSGSLITAREAILQGRQVFAFPSNVGNKGSEGTNRLLRDGAFLALSASDVLDEYAPSHSNVLDMSRLGEPPEINREVLCELDRLGVIQMPSGDAPRAAEAEPVPMPVRERKKKNETKDAEATPRKTTGGYSAEPRQEPTNENPISPKKTPDQILSSLTEVQRQVLLGMPDDRAVSPDDLRGCGKSVGEVVAALTVLELLELVEKLPGGLYTKS